MKIFEITLLFLGSVIGAGFATGAEIITFFGHLHLPIWLIATIVGLAMLLVITIEIFLYYPKKSIEITVTEQSKQTNNKYSKHSAKLIKFLDVVFVMIYLILFTAMTAGIKQITNTFVCLISLITATIITLFGIQRLSRFNTYLVAIIITLIITTALPYLTYSTPLVVPQPNNVFSAISWALLYAGLNCFMFPELITASAHIHRRRTILWASVITATIVTVLVGLILTIIKATNSELAPIPLLTAAPNAVTTVIILLAVLSSQYTALFAIIQRTQKIIPITTNKPLCTAICLSVCTLIGSYCGFNQIIKFGYPLIGAFTCFYLMFVSLLKIWQALYRHRS